MSRRPIWRYAQEDGCQSIAHKDVSGFASDMVWVAVIETGGVVKEGDYESLPLCKPSLLVGPFRVWKILIRFIVRSAGY